MNLFDVKFGHYVGFVSAGRITSRWGQSFAIEGYAVVDGHGELVGSYADGLFSNVFGERMARVSEHLA